MEKCSYFCLSISFFIYFCFVVVFFVVVYQNYIVVVYQNYIVVVIIFDRPFT
jgi:hypothetical protein